MKQTNKTASSCWFLPELWNVEAGRFNPIPGGGEVNLPPPRDNAENSKNMQAEGLLFSDF